MSIVVAIPLGILSAINAEQHGALTARVGGLSGLHFPVLVATMFLLITSLVFHWVPPGFLYFPVARPAWQYRSILFATLALSVALMAIEMRMARTSMLEVSRQDYIRTARAKGLA